MAGTFGSNRFAGKLAVVTGSTEGIGFACARRMAQDGATVVLCSRSQSKVDNAVKELHGEGLTAVHGITYDAAKPEDRPKLIKFALEVGNGIGIDLLVSNVGQLIRTGILETTEKDYDWVMDVNLKSHWLLVKDVSPLMKLRGGGAIVLMNSLSAYIADDYFKDSGAYPMSKAAMLNLTKQLAWTLGVDNIRVNGVAPGLIETEMGTVPEEIAKRFTDMTAQKRLGKVEDVSGVVAFLCSQDAAYISGETITIAGGNNHGL